MFAPIALLVVGLGLIYLSVKGIEIKRFKALSRRAENDLLADDRAASEEVA